MAIATRRRSAHRGTAALSAIMVSKENRNRALAVVGSGAALTLIASTAGAAVNGKTGVDVSASAKHMTKAVSANKAVVGADVAWSANASSADSQGDVADVAQKAAPVASGSHGVSGFTPPPAVALDSIVATAKQYVGAAYRAGATGPDAFDCSGFVQYIYRLHGINIPRTDRAIMEAGTRISAADARPGDILWFRHGHVGIYMGGDMILDASSPSTGVSIHKIWHKVDAYVRY